MTFHVTIGSSLGHFSIVRILTTIRHFFRAQPVVLDVGPQTIAASTGTEYSPCLGDLVSIGPPSLPLRKVLTF
jgi:hypothetical protein